MIPADPTLLVNILSSPTHPCPCGAIVAIAPTTPPVLSPHGATQGTAPCPASVHPLPLDLATLREVATWSAYRVALATTRGNVVEAAALLGVSRATATRAVKRLGLLPLTQGLGWEKGSGSATTPEAST